MVEPTLAVVMPVAAPSSSKASTPSVMEVTAIGFSGVATRSGSGTGSGANGRLSAIRIIWTPLSLKDATRAYRDEPIWMVVMSKAPPSSSNVLPSDIEDAAVGDAGFVILIIWAPLSPIDATRAYRDEPI